MFYRSCPVFAARPLHVFDTCAVPGKQKSDAPPTRGLRNHLSHGPHLRRGRGKAMDEENTDATRGVPQIKRGWIRMSLNHFKNSIIARPASAILNMVPF